MGDMFLDFNLDELVALSERSQEKIESQLRTVAETLATAAHAHILQKANQELKSRRELFIKSLKMESISDSTWVITLDKKASWIDDGLPAFNMLNGLLNSPKAKIIKNGPNAGGKYIIIPFHHGPDKGETESTPLEQDLMGALKRSLANRKVNWSKIERTPNGTPKTGLLHSFNFNTPIRKGGAMMPGEQGPKGRPYNAHSVGTGQYGPEGRPYLHGVRVYQQELKNQDGSPVMNKKGLPAAKRSIMTFRVASSSQATQQMWNYPGVEGKFFMDEAYKWALEEWEQKIKPDILNKFSDAD